MTYNKLFYYIAKNKKGKTMDLMTIKEVAKMKGVSEQRIYFLTQISGKNRLPSTRLGYQYFIRREDAEKIFVAKDFRKTKSK